MNDDYDRKVSRTGRSDFNFVDLTYTVSPESDVWPGEKEPEFEYKRVLDRDGVNVTRFSMNVHTQTHVDAPGHFIEKGTTIDELPLENLCGDAVVHRSTEKPKGQEIGPGDLNGSKVRLTEGDIFILNSGVQNLKGSDRYYRDFPVPSADLLERLVDLGMKCYATDCPSIDPLDSRSHENHHFLLSRGIPIVENLANLDELDEAEKVILFAFPLRLKGLEGSPCRAMAMTNSEFG
jgi:kynurenine formamidase